MADGAVRWSVVIPPAAADACDVSVVLPVYNEKGHLRAEIDRIRAALDASAYSYEIIVVDDGSNDGSEIELAADPGHPADPSPRQPWLAARPAARVRPPPSAASSSGPTPT